jgi:hypothetical protein
VMERLDPLEQSIGFGHPSLLPSAGCLMVPTIGSHTHDQACRP